MWNCTHFRHPTDEQLQFKADRQQMIVVAKKYIYTDIFFSNYYHLQSVRFELSIFFVIISVCVTFESQRNHSGTEFRVAVSRLGKKIQICLCVHVLFHVLLKT